MKKYSVPQRTAPRRCTVALAALAAGTALAFAFAPAAQAQTTANTTASVLIAAPIAISKTADLDFGTVSASASSGTVTIATNGGRSVGGGVTEFGGSPAAAAFDVTGEANSAYTITLPTNGTVTLTGPGDAMAVNDFGHDAGGSPALSSGTASFAVGATLSVGAGQTPGAYSGTFDVSVAYD